MKSLNRQIGAATRRQRLSHGLLQRDVAVRAGLPLRTIGRIERGEVDVRLSTLAKIAKALSVPLKILLP
jgi:transcriptional regulator with XRE-family HTH domain